MTGSNYLIVVGVDGSDSARQALQWAVREAHGRGGTVKAVTAWRWDSPRIVAGDGLAEERRLAETMLAHEADSLPFHMISGAPLQVEVIEGRAADVLVTASHDAALLVLGSHGHSQALHRVLGSVTEDCVRNATCPVVVIPIRYATHPVPAPASRMHKSPSAQGLSTGPQWTGDPVHPQVLPAIL
jgi:nucleotide-binding universal stress UspA family protein